MCIEAVSYTEARRRRATTPDDHEQILLLDCKGKADRRSPELYSLHKQNPAQCDSLYRLYYVVPSILRQMLAAMYEPSTSGLTIERSQSYHVFHICQWFHS